MPAFRSDVTICHYLKYQNISSKNPTNKIQRFKALWRFCYVNFLCQLSYDHTQHTLLFCKLWKHTLTEPCLDTIPWRHQWTVPQTKKKKIFRKLLTLPSWAIANPLTAKVKANSDLKISNMPVIFNHLMKPTGQR